MTCINWKIQEVHSRLGRKCEDNRLQEHYFRMNHIETYLLNDNQPHLSTETST